MSGNRDSTTDGIELHFCRDCGISIPIADIESGRANPALPGCSYGLERCTNRREAPEAIAPLAPRPMRSVPAGDPGGGGMRWVAAAALFYVVCVSTYLLVHEIRREPPEIVLPSDIAMVRDVRDLARQLEEVDRQVRASLDQLKGNDEQQATALAGVRQSLHDLSDALRQYNDASESRDRTLSRGLLALTEEAMGLKTPLGEILSKLDRMAANPVPPPNGGGPTVKKDAEPKPEGPKEDPKLRAQVEQFVKELGDKSASDQTRYNAAVQLGDLGHPSAVKPLIAALESDPYDLVKRAAAFSLGMLGKQAISAVPVLIEGVSEKETYVGYMCARALGEIAKSTMGEMVEFGYDPTMSTKQRREVRAKWQEWWEKNRSVIESS